MSVVVCLWWCVCSGVSVGVAVVVCLWSCGCGDGVSGGFGVCSGAYGDGCSLYIFFLSFLLFLSSSS